MQLTIYVRDADTWKIRMAYFKRQLTPDMDFGGLHDGALRKHPFKEHEFILRTEKY